MTDKFAVLMMSGGLDSTVLLYWALRQNYSVLPLFIDYGQHCRQAELDALLSIMPSELISALRICLLYTSYSVLGPNVGSTSRRWYNRALTPAEITDIQNGVKAIYLYGRIEYRDAFKSRKKRFTTFRLHYVGLFPPASPSAFTFSTNGNDADQ